MSLLLLFLAGRGGEEEGRCVWPAIVSGASRRSSYSWVPWCSTGWSPLLLLACLPWRKRLRSLAADLPNNHLCLRFIISIARSIVPAGQGGEGEVVLDAGLDVLRRLLLHRAHRRVAMAAIGIFGRKSGKIARPCGVLATSRMEALSEPCAGAPRLLLAKWCVPGGSKMAGGEASSSVGWSKDPIALFRKILGSSVHMFRTAFLLIFFLGPVCKM